MLNILDRRNDATGPASLASKSNNAKRSRVAALLRTSMLSGAVAFSAPSALLVGDAIFSAAAAQDATSGALTGSIVDTAGAPIGGASVTVSSNDRGFSRTTQTNSGGTFRIGQLPPGSYTVTVSAPGYASVVNENIRIQLSAAAAFNAQLAQGSSTGGDEIVVVGQARSTSAFDANTTGLTVDVGDLAARIPLQRDIQSVAILAPGTALSDSAFTAGANRGGASTQFGISGSSVGENQFLVNGFNISDFNDFIGASVLPFEFYDQVEVKTGGASAEFGRATGGIVNAVTKSGSNDFKAGVNLYWEPDFLRSDGETTYFNEFDPTQPGNNGGRTIRSANYLDETDEFENNIWLSGPLIKDRLFFFGMINQNRDSQTDIADNIAFLETNRSPNYGGKIDFFPIDSQHFEYTFFRDTTRYVTDQFDAIVDSNGNPTGVDTNSFRSTEIIENGGDNHIFKYSGTFTDWLGISASYGTGENANVRTSPDEGTPAAFDQSGTPITTFGTQILEETVNQRDAYRVDVDVSAQFLGEHQFRFGWDREELTASFNDRYPGPVMFLELDSGSGSVRGAVADPMNPGNFLLETLGAQIVANTATNEFTIRSRIADGEFTALNQAFYVQDAWSPTANLTLNLGVRIETFENRNAGGEAYFDTDQLISPRIGASWDVNGDGSLQVSGFFGRYYLPVATNTSFRLAGNERDVTSNFTALAGWDPNNLVDANGRIQNAVFDGFTTVNSDGQVKDTREQVSSNLRPQYINEYIGSVYYTVAPDSPLSLGGIFDDWTFGLSYTQRKLFDALEDAAVDAAVIDYCNENSITGCESTWSGFHHYVLINPGSDIEYATDDAPISTPGNFVPITVDGSFLPKAERTYKALTLSFERPYDGRWAFRGNYTWSDLEGNYEGSVKSDNGQTDAGITTDFDQPGFTDGAFGKLPQHRAHQLKLWGSFDITERFTVGAQYQLTSPRKFGCYGIHPSDQFAALYHDYAWYCPPASFDASTDPAGNGFTYIPLGIFGLPNPEDRGLPTNTQPHGDVATLTPRGSQLKSDWIHNVNVSMAYRPDFADDHLTLRLDVFNLFNSQGVRDLQESGTIGRAGQRIYTDPNYGEPTGYQAPRSVRLGLSFEY